MTLTVRNTSSSSQKEVMSLSTVSIPIIIAHFEAKLKLPLDPCFVKFFIFVLSNIVRFIVSLIVLCRRVNVDLTAHIMYHFFSPLHISEDLSMHPKG